MRKANYDLEGPLVYKFRYKDFFSKKDPIHIGNEQFWDGILIQRCITQVYQQPCIYDREYRDYIEDFESPRDKSGTKFYMQQVFWDHVVFTPNNRVILFESDDPSHFDKEYCELHGWDFNDIQKRDRIKNIWANKLGYDLIRLPHYLSDEQKIKLITDILSND